MPTHGYRTERRPPTIWDTILAHPFELGINAWAMIGGGSAIVTALDQNLTVSRSLDQLPAALIAVVGALLVFGGAGVFRGLFDHSDDLMVGWRRERMGLALSGFGWAAYGIAIAALAPEAFLSWSLCAVMVLTSVLRVVATVISERSLRRQIHVSGGAQ